MAARYQRLAQARLTYRVPNSDVPAEGYKVWSVLAGTSTQATTYQNKGGAANTNPIVLDSNGQCVVWANIDLDLIFCLPSSVSPTDGIIYSDPDFEYASDVVYLADVTAGTTNNKYVSTHTPVIASMPDNTEVRLVPDTDSVDTLGTVVFTGSGINDAIFSGPYSGRTPGSNFEVTIDGVGYQPAGVPGLSDVSWGGVPLLGHVYTVKISTAAGTDKFQWRKDGGAWSAEISITGAAQALTDSVTVTFAATTGHTLNDLWNNVDTFKWRKDAEAYVTGVAITAALQTLKEGIGITFSVKTGHTLTNKWTMPVMTAVSLDFCGNGATVVGGVTVYPFVYKNVQGTGLRLLDAKDFQQDVPVSVLWSASKNWYTMQGPALPVLVEIQPQFIIHEIVGNYTITDVDARHFLNCSHSGVITLATCASFANKDFSLASQDGTQITANIAGGTDLIYLPFNPVGVATIIIGAGGWDRVRFASNGVYWEIVEAISLNHGYAFFTNADDGNNWTCPDGVVKAKVTIIPPGGGGGSTDDNTGTYYGAGGGAGGAVSAYVTTVPRTNYLLTIPLGGAGALAGTTNTGSTGATASLGALLSAIGGAGGEGGNFGATSNGKGGAPGNKTGTAGTDGTFGADAPGGIQWFGQLLGNYGNGGAASHSQVDPGVTGQPACILIEF